MTTPFEQSAVVDQKHSRIQKANSLELYPGRKMRGFQDLQEPMLNSGDADQLRAFLTNWMSVEAQEIESLKKAINEPSGFGEGVSLLIHYVRANRVDLATILVEEFGADVDIIMSIPIQSGKNFVSLNVGAILHEDDGTELLIMLLSNNSPVTGIPRRLIYPKSGLRGSIEDPGIVEQEAPGSINELLAQKITLSMRYWLQVAIEQPRFSMREKRVAEATGTRSIQKINFAMVGQPVARSLLIKTMLVYFAMPRTNPLVLVFAGPSGHGKTMMGQKLADILRVPFIDIDCAKNQRVDDMFGSTGAYKNSEHGSALNNFLVANENRNCIVNLDEFEKTSHEVHNAFLKTFDRGIHDDRRVRAGKASNCLKTIFILTTNIADGIIQNYFERNHDLLLRCDNADVQEKIQDEVSENVLQHLKQYLGAPITGRITSVVPFIPFTQYQGSVIAHQEILSTKRMSRAPADPKNGRFVGLVDISLPKDDEEHICSSLFNNGYDNELGARAIINYTNKEITNDIVRRYLKLDDRDEMVKIHIVKDMTRPKGYAIRTQLRS